MTAVTKSFADALRHPSARLTQHLTLWIGRKKHDLDVLDFKVSGGFCKDYRVEITVTSPQLDIDGKDYVGWRAGLQVDERAAVPSASWTEPVDHAAATLNGVVTRWKRIRTSRDEAAYRLLIEPRFVAYCKRIIRSDVYKDVTFQEMLTQALVDRKNFEAFDVEFQIEGLQEKMEEVVMYEESLWNFITRHCRRLGVFWFYKQGRGEDGKLDTIVFANNPRAYIRSIDVPLLSASGLSSNWHEAAQAVHAQRTLVPATIELWERNYRTPEDPLRATASVSDEADDRSVFGQISRSAEGHLTPAQGEAFAQTRRDEQIARQVTLAGESDAKGIAAGVVIKLTNTKLASAEYGFVVTSFRMKGSRMKPAFTRFKAMPAHLAYRPRFDYQRDWRFLAGPVVGVVTTSDSVPYGDMDDHGRYAVLPKFLQGSGNTDNKVLKLRLLRPSSSYQGGFHSPLLPGTEVLLDGENRDVDRMHISGALHDFSHQDPVRGTDALFSYATWRSPLLGAEVVFNDLQGKESARIATVYSQTAFNQGYLLDSKKLPRGEGFEATTKSWGTMRAAKGLFLSADAPAGADTQHLDMPTAVAQLKAALQRVTDLATATTQAGADPADRAVQSALLDGLNQLRDAGLLASAPGGMAFVTPKSAQYSAGQNVIVTAGQDMDVSIVKRLRMVAGELISLCAHKLGLSLTAAKGKFTAAALTDGMDLFAQKQLRVASESADVQVSAKSKISLNCGGASVVLEGGNITFHCPGAYTIKAGSFTFVGPDNVPAKLPSLPKSSLKISDPYSSSH
ncbi:type VI secretion system secreted protein VgrG [Paraburkholderia sp. HC6.4b]|uniref:DUF2345 domain-containing protein n=1 Tax=unclassified Paraburkholderia TaxID=2615204 RepID=UPI00161BAB1D|nr:MULTISPECIES: type VI secretion system tip protein VgrG [unclassified Paraburkholderia]MBB5406189.1 type VI secretion system secreted protein VgrG [Paraburkholderia sp. HC6.4b]MBB5448585.1 type VI secretion system secreted protein VgrG [Paraburkholderia sp. Kb1A]